MAQVTEDGKGRKSEGLGRNAPSLLANTLAAIDQATKKWVQFANSSVVPTIPYVHWDKCRTEDIYTQGRVDLTKIHFMINPESISS